jgi:hypothetical protein
MSPDPTSAGPAGLSGAARQPADSTNLFYGDLISTYVDAPGVVPRDWLPAELRKRLILPDCRFVLLIGEPGAGKTGMMAGLARSNPGWLRYFIRSNSIAPLSGGEAISLMLRIGHQLAYQHPEIFDPELLEIVVNQRVEHGAADAAIVGVKIDELKVSPFYRTAIRVQQNVNSLPGSLVGIEIAQATGDPRLLDIDTLSHLALLDPAAALALKEPGETIVVLVDALDEVIGVRGATTVLDWLETCPELPPNVRFVLSSRPHPRLRTLEGVRGAELETINIQGDSEEVTNDVRSFATKLFEDTGVLRSRPALDEGTAVSSLCHAAQGNFAYLTAYARSLNAAQESGEAQALDELLGFEALPGGLYPLYATFVRRMRRQIEGLGRLEIASPGGPDDKFVAAWEGVGQRILAVFAIARAPISLEQLIALGGIRVWKSAANNVFQCFLPFLDGSKSGWQFFHPSLGEFLRSTDEPDTSDIAVDAREWDTRIVRYYQGGSAWSDVDWRAIDDYGLLHVAEHVAESNDDPKAVSELVTYGLRAAIKERFHSDLPFRRILETALAGVESAHGLDTVLSEGVFLELVHSGVSSRAARLDPAVYGLMARLGRIEEALARTEVLRPGLHKYRAIEAIWKSTPAEARGQLGPSDGVEHLISAALEIPSTDTLVIGFLGMNRNACLRDAGLAMAPHDLDRALALAEMIGPNEDLDKERDHVLAAAVLAAPPDKELALLSRMSGGRAKVAANAAERAEAGAARDSLLAFAAEHVDEENPADRLWVLSQILAMRSESDPDAANLEAELNAIVERTAADAASLTYEWKGAALDAARRLHDSYPELAALLLGRCDVPEVDAGSDWHVVSAAGVWASWNQNEDCRRLLEKALTYYRGLNWYGPARDIAKVAVIAAKVDAGWADELVAEVMALVEPVVEATDEFERSRLNGTLSGIVDAFRSWDRVRALRCARWMTGSWIPGGPWDTTDGRGSAAAVIGLDAANDDLGLATQLLAECLAGEEVRVSLGHPNPELIQGQLFHVVDAAETAAPGSGRIANFVAYVENEISYWFAGRDWRFFASPADVLRSLEFAFFPRATWARAVVSSIAPIAAADIERAIALAFWPTEPCELLISLATLAKVLNAAGDSRRDQALRALHETAQSLPQYAPELDLKKIPQGTVLLYLDPTVRARFEAAVLLPAAGLTLGRSLVKSTGSWYVEMVWQAEKLFQDFLTGADANMLTEESKGQIDALLSQISQADELVGSLVRFAYVRALAPQDIGSAHAGLDDISNRSVRKMAELYCLPFGETAGLTSAERSLRSLTELSEDIGPLHRAELAAIAAEVCANDEVSALLQWGLAALKGSGPLFEARGLIALSAVAPTAQRLTLLSRALELADHIGNEYVRDDALADSLGPALATADSRLSMQVVRRLIRSGWSTFVEALRRAMPVTVGTFGPGIVELLDAAMRRAQIVLSTQTTFRNPPGDFDGVSAVHPHDDPLGAAIAHLTEPDPAYLSMYLDRADLPALKCVQDSRSSGSDPGDEPFSRLRGRQAGLAVWLDKADKPIWRLVDIRFLFDDPADAAVYHRERLDYNSEGAEPVTNVPTVGEECAVFGGTRSTELAGQTVTLTAFSYIFRVANVVVKLFVAQGPSAKEPLTPGHLFPIAQRIVERIQTALT